MKPCFVLFTSAAFYLLTACNNNSNTSVNIDSSATMADTSTTAMPGRQDTFIMDNSMAKSMEPSMAKMHSMAYTDDFDIDFANMMIVHHQGALDMALLELEKGRDEQMIAMAGAIVTKQEKEQQELKGFVKNYKPSGMKHGEGELEKAMKEMMSKAGGMSKYGSIDADFAGMMAHHHREGVAMAKLELKHGMDNSLKKMAQQMITDQQKEISEFERWLIQKDHSKHL